MRTVKDLIEKLSELNPDAIMMFAVYEGGKYRPQMFWKVQSIMEKTWNVDNDTFESVNMILQ